MKHVIFALGVSLVCITDFSSSYGQKNQNIWAFGKGGGLDFNSGNPVPFKSGMESLLDYGEANAAIADDNGELLFYTNGSRVWDRSHNVMSNGNELVPLCPYIYSMSIILNRFPFPTSSGKQGTLVVKIPGSDHRYYIFSNTSLECKPEHGKLYFSIVDMQLNLGMGAVEANNKGILVDSLFTEGMVAVEGEDCNLWLLLRKSLPTGTATTADLFSYEITHAGLNQSPVISTLGPAGGETIRPVSLHLSPDRRKLAESIITPQQQGIALYDFDPFTGVVSNYRSFLNSEQIYGICFSPDNTKLYTQLRYGDLLQFDVSSGNVVTISNSQTYIGRSTLTQMKLAPDGKIYMRGGFSRLGADQCLGFLGCIEAPDLAGAACQFEDTALYLFPGTTVCLGLPNVSPSIIRSKELHSSTQVLRSCFSKGITLYPRDSTKLSYAWDDFSRGKQREVQESGTYWVKYKDYCYDYADTFVVEVYSLPSLMAEAESCPGAEEGKAWVKDPYNPGVSYQYRWYALTDTTDLLLRTSDSEHGDSISGLNPGTYQVRIQNTAGCDTLLTFVVTALPAAEVVACCDTLIYAGDAVQLTATGATFYTWTPAEGLDNPFIADPMARPTRSQRYTLTGINDFGCKGYTVVRIDLADHLFIPNAFSPNGDGLNDVFKLANLGYNKILAFRIFNRWGAEVFSTTDARQGWDGTYKGGKADIDTYFYFIQLASIDGTMQVFKGDVALVR